MIAKIIPIFFASSIHLRKGSKNNDITKDVYDFKWCLYFNDVQLFINISCSKHKKLKSRNLSDDICLIINPREVFDLVAPYNRSKGLKIRNHIRERICLFNQTDTYPPELGFSVIEIILNGDNINCMKKELWITPIVQFI